MSAGNPGQEANVQLQIDEARALVAQLYDPANAGNPAKINVIQERLQGFQKGPHAWLIANDLLGSENPGLSFFGALTFTVKINNDWKLLSESDTQELLGRLIDHYVALVNAGESALVVRKLASSLVTIFLKPTTSWIRAVLHVAASLANGRYISEEQCQSLDLENAVLPAMSQSQVVALLHFSNTLAEDLDKWSAEMRRNEDRDRVAYNIEDALCLTEFVLGHIMKQELSGTPVADATPGVEAINSYYSWLSVRGTFHLRDISPAKLSSTTTHVIQSLRIDSLSRTATQALLDQIDWRDHIFNSDHIQTLLDYITSDLGAAHIAAVMDGDFDDEHITFLDLLLAYSTFKQREILTEHTGPQHDKVLSLLHTLFKAPGYPAVDDLASPLVIEWWTEVADDLQEMLEDSEGQPGFQTAKQNLARAALDCFQKLLCPDRDELRDWSDENRIEFNSFRRDACDFLLAVYPMLGVELIHVFQEEARSSLAGRDWRTFEAAVYCMAQLSEAVDENQHADDCLSAIFFNDEFAQLCRGDIQIPDNARQSLVDMLGQYQSYFERTQTLLPPVLTFLFASLEISSCATAASKSIAHLCEKCRKSLTVELPAFMAQFQDFHLKPTATTSTMEKVLQGIAAIIQTLSSNEEQAQYLKTILSYLQQQGESAGDELKRGMPELGCIRAQMVLRCVGSMGRGLRAENEVIDLSDDGGGEPYPSTFWNTGPGAACQNSIMQCMQLLNDFSFDLTVVEAACDILKAGYTEKSGPYVLPSMVTVSFVKTIQPGSPGFDIVMGTASAFLASHATHPERVQEETLALIVHVYEAFCWMHEVPEAYDPEVANSGIDFLTRLLPKYHSVLFSLTSTPPAASESNSVSGTQRPPVLQAILNFILLALQRPEPLPLRSASQFWVSVLGLPNASNPNDLGAVQNAIREHLPALCHILIIQIAGGCARSDLEHLCEVLRKIVFKYQGLARPHLADTLGRLGPRDTGAVHHIASPEERERFLASVIAARGAKTQTIQLARSFWVKCRGTGFEYAE